MTLLVESPICQMSLGMRDWAQHIPLNCKFTPPFILDPISRVVRNCYKQTWSSLLTCALYPTLLFNSLKCASKVAVFNTDKTLHKVLYIFGDLCSFDVLVDVDVAQMEDMV